MPKTELRPVEQPTWTPQLVRDRMIEAVRWARYNAGPTGPAPIRSAMPSYEPTLEDHLAEGWGIPEKAEGVDDQTKVLRLHLTSEQVSEMHDRLEWVARYVCPDHEGDAVILQLWLYCRVYKKSFDGALQRRRFPLSRVHAYRMRDRALSIISQRLSKEGVQP